MWPSDEKKIRTMVYGNFHEKPFILVSYHEWDCLDFTGNDIGFWVLKGKLWILAPYFAGLCISPFPTNFATMVLWAAKKWIFILSMHGRFFVRWLQIKGRVQNGTTPIFRKVRDLEEWPYLRLHQFSRCACIYCIFGHLDDVWIQIWIVDIQIHFKHWGGEYPPRGVEPQKPRMSNWSAPCTLAHSTPTADLTYISSERVGCKTAPLQFSKVWDLEQWPIPEVTSIFSVCMHILHFWTFGWCLNSNFNRGNIKYTSIFLMEIPASLYGT
jgi:hypothetical protein